MHIQKPFLINANVDQLFHVFKGHIDLNPLSSQYVFIKWCVLVFSAMRNTVLLAVQQYSTVYIHTLR